MLEAIEHLGNVGVGVTTPQFFRADNGKTYIVKLQNNRLGVKVLVNEYLAAEFGKIMGLCFPASGMIRIPPPLLPGNFAVPAQTAADCYHYAIEYLDGSVYVGKENLALAVNIEEMAGVMLFDHMFHNADRAHNRKNLLLRAEEGGYKIYAIDNSHLFRSGRWSLNSLRPITEKIKIYYKYSFGQLLTEQLRPGSFQLYLEKVGAVSDAQVAALVGAIPACWLPDPAERAGLADFIRTRRDLALPIWEKLCKYIPQSRGGRRWLGVK